MKTNKKYLADEKSDRSDFSMYIFLQPAAEKRRKLRGKGNGSKETESVSTTTIEQTAEQTQETTQEAEEFVQTDTILESLNGEVETTDDLQNCLNLPFNDIEELRGLSGICVKYSIRGV